MLMFLKQKIPTITFFLVFQEDYSMNRVNQKLSFEHPLQMNIIILTISSLHTKIFDRQDVNYANNMIKATRAFNGWLLLRSLDNLLRRKLKHNS